MVQNSLLIEIHSAALEVLTGVFKKHGVYLRLVFHSITDLEY